MKRISKNRSVRLVLFLVVIALFIIGAPLLFSNNQTQRSVAGDSIGPLAGEASVSNLLGLGVVEAQSHTFDLCASDGTISMPDSTLVNVWGFVDTMGGACTPGLVTSLPGPTLDGITAGDSVTINLTNALTVPTSILIPGQSLSATGGAAGMFTTEAQAGGKVTYNFTAQTGTYLYESGTDTKIQIPMGLYGALIVDSGTTGQAYIGSESAYDVEAVLLLSEIDPSLNSNPAGFDMLDYHPTYWLINGKAYNATDDITAEVGRRVLLRYLNAGFDHPSMALLGGYQRVIAKEAFELVNPFDVVAETIPAGTTADMIVDTNGLGETSLALYNRNMYLTNGDSYPGGMFMSIVVEDTGLPTPTPTLVPPTPTNTPVPPTPTDTPIPPTPTDTPVPPTPTNTPVSSSHIGDLDGSSAPGGGPNWLAQVVVTVHSADESFVSGATVTVEITRIRKSDGVPVVETQTCNTNASGQCTVSRQVNSNQFENNVTFTVTNVTSAAPYNAADNHDPDGGSDGTTILVER